MAWGRHWRLRRAIWWRRGPNWPWWNRRPGPPTHDRPLSFRPDRRRFGRRRADAVVRAAAARCLAGDDARRRPGGAVDRLLVHDERAGAPGGAGVLPRGPGAARRRDR